MGRAGANNASGDKQELNKKKSYLLKGKKLKGKKVKREMFKRS